LNQAYNKRRQRAVTGRSPDEVARSRRVAEPKLAHRRDKPSASDALLLILSVVAHAKEVPHPANQAKSVGIKLPLQWKQRNSFPAV
jgi:hypothetical protein